MKALQVVVPFFLKEVSLGKLQLRMKPVPADVFQSLEKVLHFFLRKPEDMSKAGSNAIGVNGCRRFLAPPPTHKSLTKELQFLKLFLDLACLWTHYGEYLYCSRRSLKPHELTKEDKAMKKMASQEKYWLDTDIRDLTRNFFKVNSAEVVEKTLQSKGTMKALAFAARRLWSLDLLEPPVSAIKCLNSEHPDLAVAEELFALWKCYLFYIQKTNHYLYSKRMLWCEGDLRDIEEAMDSAHSQVDSLSSFLDRLRQV